MQLFAPMVHEGHWWCYVVNCQQKKLFVLDSIGHSNKNGKRIDNAIINTTNFQYTFFYRLS